MMALTMVGNAQGMTSRLRQSVRPRKFSLSRRATSRPKPVSNPTDRIVNCSVCPIAAWKSGSDIAKAKLSNPIQCDAAMPPSNRASVKASTTVCTIG